MIESEQRKPKLLVLVGPTAIGKSELSLKIAEAFSCEIISGDSMQVYRGMDIGTAKVSQQDQQRIPHHLIDICSPEQAFTVSEYQDKVRSTIDDIIQRGRLPFIVGGTGLYIESVCYDFHFSEAAMDEDFRNEQVQLAADQGKEFVHQKLQHIDPESAKKLHPNDFRRVVRALEIFHLTGTTQSELNRRQKKESPYELCIIGLTMDRKLLYERIEQRVDQMIEHGLADEVRELLEQGYDDQLTSMQALGYKEIIPYIKGEYTWEEAVYLLKRDTRRYAKRQFSWFRHMKDIEWVDVTERENFSAHLKVISGIITEKLHITE